MAELLNLRICPRIAQRGCWRVSLPASVRCSVTHGACPRRSKCRPRGS